MNGLKQALKEQGRTTVWLAQQLKVTPTTGYHWTNGKTHPNDWQKREISKLLGVSIEVLFFGNGDDTA